MSCKMSSKTFQTILFSLAIVALFVLGIGTRRAVFSAQEAPGWAEAPFTAESALHFQRVKEVLAGEDITDPDPKIQYPEGIDPSSTYSLSDEWVLAAVVDLFPDWGTLTSRVRWASLFWLCLSIPLLALWIFWRTSSRLAAGAASAFYAVMPGSVVRSTGQEISRENFALPLLMGHLAADAWVDRYGKSTSAWLVQVASALLLGLALSAWDMIRFYLLVLWLFEGVRAILQGSRNEDVSPVRFWRGPVQVLVIACFGLLNPYLASHNFITSPASIVGLALIVLKILIYFRQPGGSRHPLEKRERLIRLAAFLIPMFAFSLSLGLFINDYGHFLDLLWAKIRFFNDKPADPALLGFNARIMWVPALHSASADTVFSLFPFTLLLTLPLVLALCVRIFKSKAPSSDLLQIIVFYVITFISFLGFVRFHVFFAIFAAGIIGYGLQTFMRGKAWQGWMVWVATLLAFFGDTGTLLSQPERWRRPGIYYAEMKELIEWVDSNLGDKPILANFGISAVLASYSGNPIVLHPKFESERIRTKVKEYGRLMFKGSEADLREWMESRNVRYLVYSMGEFSDRKPEWQMRYFVDSLNSPEDAPARLFEFSPNQLKWFDLRWQNRKYRVFELTTPEDVARAKDLAGKAERALQRGKLQVAEDYAAQALMLNQYQTNAIHVLQHVGVLRDEGFKSDSSDGR